MKKCLQLEKKRVSKTKGPQFLEDDKKKYQKTSSQFVPIQRSSSTKNRKTTSFFNNKNTPKNIESIEPVIQNKLYHKRE